MEVLEQVNYSDSDLRDIWDTESFSSVPSIPYDETILKHLAEDMNLDTEADWAQILDNQPIVLNDRMMTDAVQSPHIQSEHSYSLTLNDEMPQSPFGHNIKLEDYSKAEKTHHRTPVSSQRAKNGSATRLEKDMESECFPTVSSGPSDFSEDVLIKQEPVSPPPASSPRLSTISSLLNAPSPPLHPHSLLKQPTIVLAARKSSPILFPKVNIKVEPSLSTSGFPLPPTPPSCNGSDSEGSLSPVHGGSSHQPSSPPGLLCCSPSSNSSSSSAGRKSHAKLVLPVSSSKHSNSQTALISSQPKGATGVLQLTDEEKRTLLAEGYHIPQKLPLTKAEERSLKKIRRKIKNKISAQESRRKKKEYMDALEKKVEVLSSENNEYKKKLDSLEGNNKSLLSQLQNLQAILNEMPNKRCRNAATQTIPSSNSVRQGGSSRSELPIELFESTDAKGR